MIMTERFKRFSLTALAGTLVVAIAITVAYREIATENLIEIRGEHNAEIAHSLINSLAPELEELLTHADTVNRNLLSQSPVVAHVEQAITARRENLAIRRINIFAPNGMVVYSTDAARIGTIAPDNPGIRAAIEGTISTSIVRENELNDFDRIIETEDLVQSYLPIVSGPGAKIGVFEIYSDISPLLSRLSSMQTLIVVGVFATLGTFYLLLIAMYRRIDRQLASEKVASAKYRRDVERARDELEQKVDERTHALRKERDLMQRAIDGIRDPAIVTGLDYTINIMNHAARDAFGSTLKEGARIRCAPALHGMADQCRNSGQDCVLNDQKPGRLIIHDEHGHTIEFNSIPLVDDHGETVAILQLSHRLTESEEAAAKLQKEKEAAETANRIKSEFVATMSHEIRTPMNAVIGMTDLLKLTHLTRKQRGYIQTIQSSGDMLLSLVDNILDFSKLESGALRIQSQEFDVVDLLERVLEIMGYLASSKNLELIGSLRCDMNLRVTADKRRLRQILVNLVSNAVKFTDRGEVEITVSVVRDGGETIDLGFSVADTGIGIDRQVRSQLFNPFTRGLQSQGSQHQGSGLGLTICKRLIDSMGGTINIFDRDEKGTTVEFTVPVTRAASRKVEHLPLAQDEGSARVLIIHGNERAALSVRSYLQSWSITSDLARAPNDALTMLRAEVGKDAPYSAVLVDTSVTPGDPLLVPRKIRQMDELSDLPIIALTSITEPLEVGEVTQIGRLRCINKPVLPLVLRYNLTRSLQDEADVESPHAATEEDKNPRESLSILIAEDNPVNRNLLLKMLQSEGYDADLAEDGASALLAFHAKRYDLVFMDCQMPGMDGDEVTKTVRSDIDTYHQPAVIVAITADATESHRAQCLAAGMDDFIAKPVRLDKLKTGLGRWRVVARQRREKGTNGSAASQIREQLIKRTGQNDDSFLNNYIGLFLDDTSERLASLSLAVTDGDEYRIRREGHALKGACLEFGAERMARYCEDLSAAASNHKFDEAAAVAQKLLQEFDRLRPVFESATSGND